MIVLCKSGGVGGRRIYAHMIVNIVVVRMDAETWLSRTTSNSRANLWHDGVDDNWACQHFNSLEIIIRENGREVLRRDAKRNTFSPSTTSQHMICIYRREQSPAYVVGTVVGTYV